MKHPHSGNRGGHAGPGGPRDGQRGDGQRGGPRGDGKPGSVNRPPRRDEPARPLGANTLRAPQAATAAISRPAADAPPPRRPQGQQPNRPHHGPGHDRRPAQPAPETPRGAVWLHGYHAVAAALTNPARRLRRLLVTEEAEATLVERAPPPWPLPHERAERGRLDHLLGRDTVHQGVALLADLLAVPTLAQVLERPGPILVLDQVTDPRNVGAILRSAAAFAAAGVVTQDRNAPEETGALARAASGALETMPLIRAINIARTLIALKAAGVWVVGLDSHGGAPLAGAGLRERRVALVLGAEGAGLRRLTRETCDELATLALPGVMESLNVSAAATVGLYELARGAA